MSSTSNPDTRSATTSRGLRDLADFLEAHPEAHPNYSECLAPVSLRWCVLGLDGLAAAARTLGRAKKSTDERWISVTRRFGPHEIQAYASHDAVCERVIVGTETITREVPDPVALAQVPTVTVTETVERVEWVCPPSLLAEGRS